MSEDWDELISEVVNCAKDVLTSSESRYGDRRSERRLEQAITALRERIAELEAEKQQPCKWTLEEDIYSKHFNTACGESWDTAEFYPDPYEEGYNFCPHCGKKVEYIEPPEASDD